MASCGDPARMNTLHRETYSTALYLGLLACFNPWRSHRSPYRTGALNDGISFGTVRQNGANGHLDNSSPTSLLSKLNLRESAG
jgi:hypothetical protein